MPAVFRCQARLRLASVCGMPPSASVLALVAGPVDRRLWQRLRERYPEARLTRAGAEVPLGSVGPEEVLAACCSLRVPVRASAVLMKIERLPDAG